MTCRDCMYWNEVRDAQGASTGGGQCRRYPPVPQALPNYPLGVPSLFPLTGPEVWCGEYLADAPAVQREFQEGQPTEPLGMPIAEPATEPA